MDVVGLRFGLGVRLQPGYLVVRQQSNGKGGGPGYFLGWNRRWGRVHGAALGRTRRNGCQFAPTLVSNDVLSDEFASRDGLCPKHPVNGAQRSSKRKRHVCYAGVRRANLGEFHVSRRIEPYQCFFGRPISNQCVAELSGNATFPSELHSGAVHLGAFGFGIGGAFTVP